MHPYEKLLQQLNLPELEFLGKGMQCLVFADGSNLAVKIYETSIGVANLQRLMHFYNTLDTDQVKFRLPEIVAIEQNEKKIIVTEKRLHGISPTLDYMQQMGIEELHTYFRHYVDVLFQIQNITTDFLQPGEPLDQSGDFCKYGHYGNWQTLLTANLHRKMNTSGKYYIPFVEDLDNIVERITARITTLPLNDDRLIHGDFYPANTLMDKDFNITAVLDFGTYTLVGDPIYDIALGWIFADMYQDVKQLEAKNFVGNLICERISEEEWHRIKLYILIYSLLSADIYSDPEKPDGHFQWAMNNLNNNDFREVL